MKNSEKGFAPLLILVIIIGLILTGFFVLKGMNKTPSSPETAEGWSTSTKILDGYADADIVSLDDGKYRMYFGDVPSSNNFIHGIFSAISLDGKSWTMEEGVRQANAAFPDVIKLKDGSYRMYFQGGGGIQSATSKDGLNWVKEQGMRIDTVNNAELKLTQVGASTTTQIDDGTFVMVYRGTIDDTYDKEAPNKGTNLFLWATSSDGLNFQKQGIAVNSRNTTYLGFLDGADFSKWDDTLRLYYWTYSGIYYSVFDGKTFTGENIAISAKSDNPMAKFSPNPPGDPSIIKIGSTWFMYYGKNNEGNQELYYVTLIK